MKIPARKSSFIAVNLLACVAVTAFAQQPAASPASPSSAGSASKVTEIVVPVTVRDKKGQPVSNLKADDFTLNDNADPQTIKSFTRETALPNRYGLLVDTSRNQEAALADERSATGKFVDAMLLQPTDKAFLLHFDHEVELLQDFTAAKPKLHHELDEMSSSSYSGGQGSQSGGDSEEGGGRRHGGKQMYDAIYLASNELMLKDPGRKVLIVLSDGVDRGSKESLNDSIDAAEKANVEVYTVYFKGEEEHNSSGGPGMGRRGGTGGGGYPGGGGGYPGGGRGGQRPGGASEVKVDGKKILEQIASRTGGIYFEAKKKDSFDEIYTQIGDQIHGQYFLTYTPDKASIKDESDRFHKILLKAKDEKYAVTTPEGYYSTN
jgi:VWFA-related protein